MEDGSDGSRLPGWLFLLALGGLPILILSVVAVVFDINSHGQATGSPYSSVITGHIPLTQHLHRRVQLHFALRNTGPAIPETVLLFTGLESWSIESARAGSRTEVSSIDTLGNGEAWQFGPLRKNARLHITLNARPVRVGHATVTLKAFAGIDSSGSPDPTVEIHGDGKTWSRISVTQ